jgi:phage tail sheath gpL-like
MTLIPITGVPSSFRVPGGYVEILMAQGPATAAVGSRDVVMAMPKLSTAGLAYTAATLYEVSSEQDVILGAGPGSPLHRGVRKFLQCNKTNKLFALPVTETAGTAATFQITVATDPTAAGQCSIRICDEVFTYSFVATPTDTVTTIATGLKNLINNATHLPVTAGNAAGVITLTAKLKGISQGNGTLDVIQVRNSISPNCTTTITASGAVGDTVPGAEGGTAEAANLATALAAIDSKRIYFICSSANDTTSYANLATHILNKSAANVGMRSVGIAAYTGALAGIQTLAIARNYERLQLVWQENSDHDSAELAANMAAIRSKYEDTDPAYNFAGYSANDWRINVQYATADYPTATDQNDAINDGITCIASGNGASYVVMSVSTRSKTAAGGSVDDFRACETHRLSVCDAWSDEVLTEWALMFSGKKLASDELLADGTVNPNQKVIRGVVKPKQSLEPWLKAKLQDYEDKGYTQDAAASKESLRVVRCDTNSSRVECSVDIHAIDHFHQFTMRVAEVSAA